MKLKISSLLLLSILYSTMACNPSANSSFIEGGEIKGEKIEVGPGPEDMVLDTLHGTRLLISCSARRDEYRPYGEIEALDLRSMERKILLRHGEPDSLNFHPHGIYLAGDLLYVISHEKEPDVHPILIYRLSSDSLEFIEEISNPLLNSPNALVRGPNGEIYVVNDSGKRGSIMEKVLKLKRASLIMLKKSPEGLWESQIMAIELGYPAGINRIGNTIYAGDAIQNQLHVFRIGDKGLTPMAPIKNLKGNDNLRIHDGKILTCCHVKPVRFIGHAKNPDKPSPVKVFLADPKSGDSESLFTSDGTQISGASTAIIHDKILYISQVFEPFLLRVELEP